MRPIHVSILRGSLDGLRSCQLSHSKQPPPSGLDGSLRQHRTRNRRGAAGQGTGVPNANHSAGSLDKTPAKPMIPVISMAMGFAKTAARSR